MFPTAAMSGARVGEMPWPKTGLLDKGRAINELVVNWVLPHIHLGD